ncbi:ThiF family adenylyltransferase [Natranaerobius trueperi]|uniref:THIF-type NAD/FAD binding fold domain-containing protein n=1 Tax=Natranaerobius trueperi TaxID=759412 RepID=A0A226C0V3_9FIRM|nr:ThiF family adenylyltransferase [Natranaerobius trueperi]OWZ84791.1 hypothetical protein CDO51_01885 [Natranaerobius trueperi]
MTIPRLVEEIQRFQYKVEIKNELVNVISIEDELYLSSTYQLNPRKVQQLSLKNGILPLRYSKNYNPLGINGQLSLLHSTIGVVGVGELGKAVIEIIARIGIGHIIIIDHKDLNETNFTIENNIGIKKITAAAKQVEKINSGVSTTLYSIKLNQKNVLQLLDPCDVVVDATNDKDSSILLENTVNDLNIPLVHSNQHDFTNQVTPKSTKNEYNLSYCNSFMTANRQAQEVVNSIAKNI